MLKRSLFTFLAAAAISAPALLAAGASTPAAAQEANLSISLGGVAPFEAVPAPRPGYLWQAGYWRYEHGHRYWEHGSWREREHEFHHHYWR